MNRTRIKVCCISSIAEAQLAVAHATVGGTLFAISRAVSILDSGRANAAIADLGGTGRVHDWGISCEFVRRSSKPVFLAGGLCPGNAREAISTVAPFGLDVCSGVRKNHKLDAQLLDAFTASVWGK